ncbi:UNVERIFIED_CONTAM: hypothetical protein GTU68_009985 [Idotea baltica]|nr:hypothetical protein [Idotea baltica]
MTSVPKNHPRYQSLMARHLLEEGVGSSITTMTGLVAHGRGEAFDYLIGERTRMFAKRAAKAAAAQLLLAQKPVISINGNTAMLATAEMISLSEASDALLEINLFHDAPKRRKRIEKRFKEFGAKKILGVSPDAKLRNLTSDRAKVDSRGMLDADVVLVSLEDGDRTEILVSQGKKIIAIDLNPLSRTPKKANISIVDNVIRALPCIETYVKQMQNYSDKRLQKILDNYDNRAVLKEAIQAIRKGV